MKKIKTLIYLFLLFSITLSTSTLGFNTVIAAEQQAVEHKIKSTSSQAYSTSVLKVAKKQENGYTYTTTGVATWLSPNVLITSSRLLNDEWWQNPANIEIQTQDFHQPIYILPPGAKTSQNHIKETKAKVVRFKSRDGEFSDLALVILSSDTTPFLKNISFAKIPTSYNNHTKQSSHLITYYGTEGSEIKRFDSEIKEDYKGWLKTYYPNIEGSLGAGIFNDNWEIIGVHSITTDNYSYESTISQFFLDNINTIIRENKYYGWVQVRENYQYMKENGQIARNEKITIDDYTYDFAENGSVQNYKYSEFVPAEYKTLEATFEKLPTQIKELESTATIQEEVEPTTTTTTTQTTQEETFKRKKPKEPFYKKKSFIVISIIVVSGITIGFVYYKKQQDEYEDEDEDE